VLFCAMCNCVHVFLSLSADKNQFEVQNIITRIILNVL
jgi:hypothetical protein